jgi:serine/threonine protein kinase
MNVKIVKKIGEGVYGTIYKTKYNKKDTIFKLERIGNDFSDYREQVLFDVFARKHPGKFMILEAHGIINECKHEQKIADYIEGDFKKEIIEKNKSFECYYLIYSPIYKATIMSITHKLYDKSYKLYAKCLSQILEQLMLMHADEITHNDIHTNNIMFDKDGDFHLIDYGRVIMFKPKDKRFKEFVLNDIISFLFCMVPNSVIIYMNEKKYKFLPFEEQLKFFEVYNEWRDVERYLPKLKITAQQKIDLKVLLMILLHYDIYTASLKFNDIKNVKIISLKGRVQCDMILFIIKNIDMMSACLIYLKTYL